MPTLRSRSVVAFLVGALCTSTASGAAVVALGKLVYDITDREFDLGLLGLAEFAPAALLVFVSGPIADRYDRRRVVAIAALGEGVAMLALARLTATDPTTVGTIFALVIVFGIFRAFMAPAARSMPGDIVDAADLPRLVARYALTWQVSLVIGPVLGGMSYAVDPALPFVVTAILLVFAAVAISIVPAPSVRVHHDDLEAPKLSDAFEGLRFIRSRPVLFGAISLDLCAVLFGGAVALLPAIAEDRLGVGSVGLGWLRAAVGIGAGLMTLLLGLRPIERAIGRNLLGAVAVFGVFTIALGTTTNYVVAFIALAVLSGADAISVFIRATLVPLMTPPDRRGRVLAVENVFIGASNELGAFESGVVARFFGTTASVISGGIATLVVAVMWWFVFPGLRDLDQFPTPDEAS